MTAETLVHARDLAVCRGRSEVLHGLNVELSAGEVLAVIGPNGAGKSTLIETIGGVLQPSRGTLDVRGRVATALQSPDLAARSARANIELALAWWGVARRERRARAHEALAAMRAEHLADRPAVAMSGGERRRVHLARAVAIRPDVLLLDEPFAGLDPTSRGALLDDAGAAIRDNARAAVLVVHDRAEAWALADRLVVIIDGQVAATGAPRDVLQQPPTPEVARFLGFTGQVRDGDSLLLARPSQVRVVAGGDITATVTRLIPLEDGVRVGLEASNARLEALTGFPGPTIGEVVTVTIDGGVRFPASGG